ncbi:MAG: oxidoreductase [Paenibacillus sp.]|nr:oxidoreductase [Paenibacillus sp.]
MGLWGNWRRKTFGKKLSALHTWNAWLVLLLTVSGILLFFQPFRELGVVRVLTKEAHIWLGLLSTVIVLIYLPKMIRHIRQLRGKPEQQWNLAVVLVLLVGWIVSGILLWQFRRFPPIWSNVALTLHDLITWVGVPYAIFHSVTRSRWLKMRRPGAVMQRETNGNRAQIQNGAAIGERGAAIQLETPRSISETIRDVLYTRRSFIRWGIAGLLVVLIGPKFGRWLFSGGGSGGVDLSSYDPTKDGNAMLPAPQPLPDSIVPIGGGSQGQYRIYSVTPIPAFSSDNWKFTLTGLVDKPQSWNWNEFTELARSVQVSDFHCVTGWSVYKNTWEGIKLSKLLEMAGVQSKALMVKFYSGDGVYTDSLTLAQAALDDVMVAVLLDGKPIPQKLGGPVRLIVPKMYAYKSVKWLQGIELIDEVHIGYWEVRGYDIDAWVPGLRPKNWDA